MGNAHNTEAMRQGAPDLVFTAAIGRDADVLDAFVTALPPDGPGS